MLRVMEAIDDDTPVVTCIHDCQLVDDIPAERMLCHDVPVDIICTPTRTIRVDRKLPKPTGIYWDKLSPQKLASIRILQQLKRRLEEKLGEELPSGPAEVLPPTAQRTGKGKGAGKGKGKGEKGKGKGEKGEKGENGKGKGDRGEKGKGEKGQKDKAKDRPAARGGGGDADSGAADQRPRPRRWQPKVRDP
ncbi:unnamed protein product [Prorocentrum cordatum]|uniref:Methenyltetrahydrofolate synthase domain-containing protein n=1 Tax=Prorocentrum cordatum TaxID=2364126 RepID=A0ABN9PV23_9DINO|nr:unnamed protein product [Polarella glacialis]